MSGDMIEAAGLNKQVIEYLEITKQSKTAFGRASCGVVDLTSMIARHGATINRIRLIRIRGYMSNKLSTRSCERSKKLKLELDKWLPKQLHEEDAKLLEKKPVGTKSAKLPKNKPGPAPKAKPNPVTPPKAAKVEQIKAEVAAEAAKSVAAKKSANSSNTNQFTPTGIKAEVEAEATEKGKLRRSAGSTGTKLVSLPHNPGAQLQEMALQEDPADAARAMKLVWPDVWRELCRQAAKENERPIPFMIAKLEKALAARR